MWCKFTKLKKENSLWKSNLPLFIKFNLFSFLELFLTIYGFCCTHFICYKTQILQCKLLYLPVIFGVYRTICSFASYKQRLKTYRNLKSKIENRLKENKTIHKAFVYDMRDSPCTWTVVKQLSVDFPQLQLFS